MFFLGAGGSWRGEKARQAATELLGGEGFLDPRVAVLVGPVGLLGSLEVAPHSSGGFGRSSGSLAVEAPGCIARITATGA